MNGEPIQIYNKGDMYRDFTYIDDIVSGVENILCNPPEKDEKGAASSLYNIGNHQPVKLMEFIETLEKCLGRTAVKVPSHAAWRCISDVCGCQRSDAGL